MTTREYENSALAVWYSVSDGGDSNIIIHCHTNYEILYFIRGDVRYIIEGVEYNLRADSFLLIPPNVVHGVKACGDGTYQRCVLSLNAEGFDGDSLQLLESVFSGRACYENGAAFGIDSAFDDIFKAIELGEYPVRVAVEALLVRIKYMQSHADAFEPTIAASSVVSQIIEYLNDNFCEHITLDGISARFYISKHHLNKLFRLATGVTVGEYVIYKRVFHARALMRRGVRAGEAAELSGFSDYSTFYKAYIKRMGHSPLNDRIS